MQRKNATAGVLLVAVSAAALLLSKRITAAMIVGGCLVLASLLITVFAERKAL